MRILLDVQHDTLAICDINTWKTFNTQPWHRVAMLTYRFDGRPRRPARHPSPVAALETIECREEASRCRRVLAGRACGERTGRSSQPHRAAHQVPPQESRCDARREEDPVSAVDASDLRNDRGANARGVSPPASTRDDGRVSRRARHSP